MSEKEAMRVLKMTDYWIKKDYYNVSETKLKAIDTVLQALKDKDNKIKELEADLYSANCTINEYIEERNKLKDKMITLKELLGDD